MTNLMLHNIMRCDVIYGMLDSEIKLKSFVFLSSLILIFVGYYGFRKQDNDMVNEFDYFSSSIIVSISCIYSLCRGYLEAPL